MDKDALLVGEVDTHAMARRAAGVMRETLNSLSQHVDQSTPVPAKTREADLVNTHNRSFHEERCWTRRAFGALYSSIWSLYTTFLQRNGVFQFTAICTPKTGERLKTYLFRIFYITSVFLANLTRRVDDTFKSWAGADELSTFGESLAGISRKARLALQSVFETDALTFFWYIVLDLKDFSNTALVEEGFFTAFHHLATGNASQIIEEILFTRNFLSPLWGLLKDLHRLSWESMKERLWQRCRNRPVPWRH